MRKIRVIAIEVSLALLIGTSFGTHPAAAETLTPLLKFTLHYPVAVGAVTIPSGDYTIRNVDTGNDSPVLAIHSETGTNVNVLANRIQIPQSGVAEKTELVITGHGGHYQLDKIWIAGQEYGYEIVGARH